MLLMTPAIGWSQNVVLDGEWIWFRATSTYTSWFRTGGKGVIKSSGKTFQGQLFDEQDRNFVRHDVSGSISGTSVKARVVINNSGSPDDRLSGQLKRLCYKQGGGREIMVLTDGLNIVGLSRELDKEAACKPTP